MKKIAALGIGWVLLAAPALAFAAPANDLQTQLQFILARNSTLVAGQPVSCFLATSASHVKVGESFTFMWFSTGANSQTAHNGIKLQPYGVQTIALDRVGTWTYTMKFYDSTGTAVSCSVIVAATS